jgi:hypothetical protein
MFAEKIKFLQEVIKNWQKEQNQKNKKVMNLEDSFINQYIWTDWKYGIKVAITRSQQNKNNSLNQSAQQTRNMYLKSFCGNIVEEGVWKPSPAYCKRGVR